MEAHQPVLLKDFISLATPITGCWVDCTFGAGGYSRALLQNGASQVLAIDSGQNLNWQTPDIMGGKEWKRIT